MVTTTKTKAAATKTMLLQLYQVRGLEFCNTSHLMEEMIGGFDYSKGTKRN